MKPSSPLPRLRAWAAGDLAALAVTLALFGAVARPALTSPVRGIVAYDTSFTQVATEHLQDVLLHGADWRAAPLGWPLGYGTALSDWQAAEALLGLPLRLAGTDPSRVALLLALAGLVATAWAGHRLARALLGPGPHTWLAAVLTSLSPLALVHLQHINLLHHEGMLLAALLLGAGLEEDRPWLAGAGAACAVGSVHLGVYMGVHAGVAAGAVAGVAALARRGSRRSWAAAALGAALAGLSVLPVLSFYRNADIYLDTSIQEAEVRARSWDLAALWTRTTGAPLHEHLDFLPDQGDFPAHPGFLALGLGLAGLGLSRRLRPRWAWVAVAAVGALGLSLSLGPEISLAGHPTGIPGPYAWFRHLPGMENLREPWRWQFLTLASLGLFAAAALQTATARLSPWQRAGASLVVIAAVGGELPRTQTTRLDQWRLPDVYAVLSTVPTEGAFSSTALAQGHRACGCTQNALMRAALLLRRPLVFSQYARRVPAYDEVIDQVEAWPAQTAAQALAGLGVVAMVEHPPVRSQTPRGWFCQGVGDHRLCVLNAAQTWVGLGRPPAYAEAAEGEAWMPALPIRDRDLRDYAPF